MPVRIDLELQAGDVVGEIGAVVGALEALERQVESIDDLDLDSDFGEVASSIAEMVDEIEDLEDRIGNITDEVDDALGDLDDITVTVEDPDGQTGSGDSSGNDPPDDDGSGRRYTKRGLDFDFDQPLSRDARVDSIEIDIPDSHVPPDFADLFNDESLRGLRNNGFPDFGSDSAPSSGRRRGRVFGGVPVPRTGFMRQVRRVADDFEMGDFAEEIGQIRTAFGRAIPNMQMWYNALAAIMPLLIAFAAQAMGVAAALGAVAVAGAAVVGLGLVGQGEDMNEAWSNAQDTLSTLKEDLYEVMQPAMQAFAPISTEFFNWAPGQLAGIADAMQGLTQYEDTIFAAFSGATNVVESFFRVITEHEDTISQLAMRFGSIIGSGIIDFFEWLVLEAARNQEVLIDLGSIFADLAMAVYQIAALLARMVSVLGPLAGMLRGIATLLNNDFIAGFLVLTAVFAGFILTTFKVVTALMGVYTALAAIGGSGVIATIVGGIARITGMLYGLIAAAWQANMALGVLATLATGGLALGAMAVGYGAMKGMAGDRGATGGGGGYALGGQGAGGTVYNDNRQYTINNEGNFENDYAQRKRMENTVTRVTGQQGDVAPPGTNGGDN